MLKSTKPAGDSVLAQLCVLFSVGFLIAHFQEQIFDFQINSNMVKKIRCINSYRKFAESLSHKGFEFGQNILCITKNCLLLHL